MPIRFSNAQGAVLIQHHTGCFFQTPGIAWGINDYVEMTPALPKDVACPGAARSIRRTGMPLSCSDRAQQIPTMPMPIDARAYYGDLLFHFVSDAFLHARNCVMSIGDVMTDLKASQFSNSNLLSRWDATTVSLS